MCTASGPYGLTGAIECEWLLPKFDSFCCFCCQLLLNELSLAGGALPHWRRCSLASLCPHQCSTFVERCVWLFLAHRPPAAFMGETSKKSLSDFLQFIPTYLQQASVGCCAFRPPGGVMPLPATRHLPCKHCHGSALLE